jgi:hypothetical protein
VDYRDVTQAHAGITLREQQRYSATEVEVEGEVITTCLEKRDRCDHLMTPFAHCAVQSQYS